MVPRLHTQQKSVFDAAAMPYVLQLTLAVLIPALYAACQALYFYAFLYELMCVVYYETTAFALIYALASVSLSYGMHARAQQQQELINDATAQDERLFGGLPRRMSAAAAA